MVGDRQIEPYGGFGADLGRWILGRQDPPLHRGELGMFAEKFLDFVEITRRGDKVVVKAYDYVSDGLPDGYVLDPAFAGARVVQMFQGRRRRGERRRRGRAVFGEKDFARRFARGAGDLRRETVEQAFERVGTRVSRDYDGDPQNNSLAKGACPYGVRAVRSKWHLEFALPAD